MVLQVEAAMRTSVAADKMTVAGLATALRPSRQLENKCAVVM